MIEASVIMPCHNRAYDLVRALKAYDEQTTTAFEVIAVDDASTDATYQVLSSYHPASYALRVLRQEQNRGPAAARNEAIAVAQGYILIFVGDDIRPLPDLVQAHLAAHKCRAELTTAILGSVAWPPDLPCNTLMRHIDGVGAQQFSYHYLEDGSEYDFRHFYTSNVSVKSAFLRSLDRWFDTDFHFAGYEDVELAYRLRQRGLRILYSRQPMAYHYHYHTTRTFAVRQYNSGLMSCVLFRKHPRLLSELRTPGWRQLTFLSRLGLWLESPLAVWVDRRVARFLQLETPPPPAPFRGQALPGPDERNATARLELAALRLASFYEWSPNELLDRLYIGLLGYFEKKGILDGTFGRKRYAARIRHFNACRHLLPLLRAHVQAATRAGIPLPSGYDRSLLLSLAADPISAQAMAGSTSNGNS